MDSPEVWLDRVLAAPDPLLAAELAVAAGSWPPGLVRVVEDRYPHSQDRRLLAWLLGKSGDDGARALARLLETASGKDAANLLGELARTGPAHANPATVRRLLADSEAGWVAADLAGMSGDHSFVPDLVPLLKDRDRRCNAAIALGRLHAREHTARIAAKLRRLKGMERQAFIIALELMGDPTVVPTLLRGKLDGDVHHALVCLTGRHPLVEDLGKPAAIRAAWKSVDVTAPAQPDLRDVRVSRTRADFALHDGLGRIQIDDDTPSPGALYPRRWSMSLRVAGTPVYRLGSTCGTCASYMRLTGWPAERVAESSARLRDRLADLPQLDTDLIDAARPLLVALHTGHYRAFLVDLDMELVNGPETSWWHQRPRWRDEDDDEDDDEDEPYEPWWPPGGFEHFQLREPIPGSPPAYCMVMPSRSPELLREQRVAEHGAAITAGARPAALLWGWVDDRLVRMEHPERLLLAVVLDGHHKLIAYARAGVPARAVLLSRMEDNWGPPGDRDRYLLEVTTPLRTTAGAS